MLLDPFFKPCLPGNLEFGGRISFTYSVFYRSSRRANLFSPLYFNAYKDKIIKLIWFLMRIVLFVQNLESLATYFSHFMKSNNLFRKKCVYMTYLLKSFFGNVGLHRSPPTSYSLRIFLRIKFMLFFLVRIDASDLSITDTKKYCQTLLLGVLLIVYDVYGVSLFISRF